MGKTIGATASQQAVIAHSLNGGLTLSINALIWSGLKNVQSYAYDANHSCSVEPNPERHHW